MEADIRFIVALPGNMELGLIFIGRSTGGAKRGAIAAFIAVISQIQNLDGLFDANGSRIADQDLTVDLSGLLDLELHRVDRKLDSGSVRTDRHTNAEQFVA